MTKINRKTLFIALVVIVLIAVVSVSAAWFVQGVFSDKFKLTVAYVETKVTILRGEDNNKDGILERDIDGNPKFTPLGDSVDGSIKLDSNGNPILVDGKPICNSDIKVKFDIAKMMPTQVYTWKIIIQNMGDVMGKVTADYTILINEISNKMGIDTLSSRLNALEKVFFGNCYTSDPISGERQQVVKVIDGEILDCSTGDEINPDSIGEYIIRVEMESLENLRAAGINMTADEYEAYMLRKYENINLSVRIEDYKQGKQ